MNFYVIQLMIHDHSFCPQVVLKQAIRSKMCIFETKIKNGHNFLNTEGIILNEVSN